MAMKNFSILVYCYDFENQYRMWYTGYLVRLVSFVLVFFYSFLKTTYRSVTESYPQYVIHTCVFSHCLILHSVDRHTLISIFNKKLQVLYLRNIFIEYIFLQIHPVVIFFKQYLQILRSITVGQSKNVIYVRLGQFSIFF